MVHLEHWENKQSRVCFLPASVALFGMRVPNTSRSSPKQEVLFKIKLFIWHFWETLFWGTTAMNGLASLLRRNQFIFLVLFLLQIQSLGLDINSRPTAEVCATHTISPGPKGEEKKPRFSCIINMISFLVSEPLPRFQWLSLLSSLVSSHFPSILENQDFPNLVCYLFKALPWC